MSDFKLEYITDKGYVNNIEHSKEKLIKTIDNMQRIDTS